MQKIIALATLIIALFVVNWSIYEKQQILENGQIVFLKLAPIDPRSLMQGDYMALQFEIANQIRAELKDNDQNQHNNKLKDGFVSVQLDERGVASFVSIGVKNITPQTISLQFRIRKGRVKFATNAYFFEEGSAKNLERAKYGKFRVSQNGELLLVTLHDNNLKKVG